MKNDNVQAIIETLTIELSSNRTKPQESKNPIMILFFYRLPVNPVHERVVLYIQYRGDLLICKLLIKLFLYDTPLYRTCIFGVAS